MKNLLRPVNKVAFFQFERDGALVEVERVGFAGVECELHAFRVDVGVEWFVELGDRVSLGVRAGAADKRGVVRAD